MVTAMELTLMQRADKNPFHSTHNAGGLSKTKTELPEMLVLDILSKLPVKSLTRFKCVCKAWSSSFQTPFFITQQHHNNLRNNSLNLLLKRNNGDSYHDIHFLSQLSTEKGQDFSLEQDIPLPFFDDHWHRPLVYGHCNGLLCLISEDKLALWNPSIRQFKILPESSVQRPPSAYMTRFGNLGFGYDSQSDDYKVVRFVTNYFGFDDGKIKITSHVTMQIDLYSLRGNSWKEIPLPQVNVVHDHPWLDNHVNGIFYWVASGATVASDFCVLSFDMANERFSTLALPRGILLQHGFQLLNFNGLLGAMAYTPEETMYSFDLWVMSGSWTKLFSIKSVPGVWRSLGFWKNGEFFFENSDNELMLFDPATRELKNLGIHAYNGAMQIIFYVESLVPLGSL
ncbi:hypothetical protein V6N13_024173 [Hibiscus sabdariffa]